MRDKLGLGAHVSIADHDPDRLLRLALPARRSIADSTETVLRVAGLHQPFDQKLGRALFANRHHGFTSCGHMLSQERPLYDPSVASGGDHGDDTEDVAAARVAEHERPRLIDGDTDPWPRRAKHPHEVGSASCILDDPSDRAIDASDRSDSPRDPLPPLHPAIVQSVDRPPDG